MTFVFLCYGLSILISLFHVFMLNKRVARLEREMWIRNFQEGK